MIDKNFSIETISTSLISQKIGSFVLLHKKVNIFKRSLTFFFQKNKFNLLTAAYIY